MVTYLSRLFSNWSSVCIKTHIWYKKSNAAWESAFAGSVCLILQMSLFSLSRSWGKTSLRSHYCSPLTLLQHSFFAELCKKGTEVTTSEMRRLRVPLNFCTWLPTWPWASHVTMSIMLHLSLPPIPRSAQPPASTRRLIWLASASYCLAVKAISHTSPAHVLQLLLVSEIPETRCSWSAWHTAHQQLLRPTGSKRNPMTELCLEMSGQESSCKSLLLTGTPPGHTFTSQGLVMWPVTSVPCHITGHKVALPLWRSKYLTNVCRVPNRIQFLSWRILLYATAIFNDNKGRSAFFHLCWSRMFKEEN